MRELLQIYGIFFRIGAFTFGGGYSMLPILEHELAEKRGWLSDRELMDYFAVSQSLPGIIAVNVATFCGARRRGFLGSLAAVLGIVTPSILIILFIAAFIRNFTDLPLVQKALRGVNLAVAGLLLSAVLKMGRASLRGPLTVCIAVLSFLAVQVLHLPVVPVLLVSVGAVFLAREVKKHG